MFWYFCPHRLVRPDDFAAIISQASTSETFYAGEVMELEISGLGVLTNAVVAPQVLQVPAMPIHILE